MRLWSCLALELLWERWILTGTLCAGLSQDRKSGGVWRAQGKGYMGHLCHQRDCSVMCRHWPAAKVSPVSWREPWAALLSAGSEEESINRVPSALDEWSKGGFLGSCVYVLLQWCLKPTKTLRILSGVWKRTSRHGLFSLATRNNKKVRQRKQNMHWALILCGNPGLCFCLFTAYFKTFKYASQKGWQKWLASPRAYSWVEDFLWNIVFYGCGRSSGAWSGWDCWPEEICVSAVTHCFQESQKNAWFQNWPVRVLLAAGR